MRKNLCNHIFGEIVGRFPVWSCFSSRPKKSSYPWCVYSASVSPFSSPSLSYSSPATTLITTIEKRYKGPYNLLAFRPEHSFFVNFKIMGGMRKSLLITYSTSSHNLFFRVRKKRQVMGWSASYAVMQQVMGTYYDFRKLEPFQLIF